MTLFLQKIKVYSNSEEFRQMNRSLLELILNATENHQNQLSDSINPALITKFDDFHDMLTQNLNLKKKVSSSFNSLSDYEDQDEY